MSTFKSYITNLNTQKEDTMEQLIEEYFTQAGLSFRKVSEEGDIIFITALSLTSGTFEVYVIIDRTCQTVTLFINSPIPVPEPKRAGVAEYLTRINYHGREGSLKLDFSDGMLCYCYVLRYDPESDTRHIAFQLDVSLGMGIDELEEHFPGILAVTHRDLDPAQAIAEAAFGCKPELN